MSVDRGRHFHGLKKYAYAFSGPYNKAEVALTFDDGPDLEFTSKILDKLKQHNVKATFSLLGENRKVSECRKAYCE